MKSDSEAYIDGPRWLDFEIVMDYLAKIHNIKLERWTVKRLLRKRVYFQVEGEQEDIINWIDAVEKHLEARRKI